MKAVGRLCIAGFVFAVAAAIKLIAMSAAVAEGRNPLKIPNAQYEWTKFTGIEGWAEDDHDAAFSAFRISCKAILRRTDEARKGKSMLAALYNTCRKASELNPAKPGEARIFFETHFVPVRISPLGSPDGFVTGYYEPIVEGVRNQKDGYDFPLYRPPTSLLAGGRMAIAGVAAGKKKARKRRLVTFHDRAAIDDGVLAGRKLEICWLRDPIDAFFIHIQGSVRVRLEDGNVLRLNYQAQNGHPYYAVGRYLIERNIVPKDEMSMDRIREWMERNPAEGQALRRKNKSYIFFREIDIGTDEEPTGAQGVALTPGRSIAVDRKLHVYGTPFFISADLPIETDRPDTAFRRLMVAQDTGGAIIGPARADIYFGAGDEAASIAGRLRHSGQFTMLVPRELSPKAVKEHVPLPQHRPKSSDQVAEAKISAKSKAVKTGKAKQ